MLFNKTFGLVALFSVSVQTLPVPLQPGSIATLQVRAESADHDSDYVRQSLLPLPEPTFSNNL